MNKELLTQTIAWLEAGAPERQFNMSKMIEYEGDKPTNWCGTACCIAGYVWQQNKTPEDIEGGLYAFWDTIERQATEMLELEFPVAHRLFFPATIDPEYGSMSYQGEWDAITPRQAAQAVRNVMDRGEPHWEEILDFSEEEY